MNTGFIFWCLFQKRSLVLSPTIPFKNFSSLHSMCMEFLNLTFLFEQHTFVPEKSLKSRFCDFKAWFDEIDLSCQFRRFLARTFRRVIHMWDMPRSNVYNHSFDSFHMCGNFHSYVWHDSFKWATWIIHVWEIIHPYVRHDALYVRHDLFKCVTWLMHTWHGSFICDVTSSYVCHDSFICVTWCIYVRHDSFICATRHIHKWHGSFICNVTSIYVCHDSFIRVAWRIIWATWLIHMCDMTHSHV